MQPRKLSVALADAGHDVHVVASDLNVYSEQAEPEEAISTISGGGVFVHRVKEHSGLRRSLAARLKNYLGYVRPALQVAATLPRPDIVLASVQPLFAAWAGRRVARKYGVPWLLEVRDLWPDALEVKGAIRSWQARPLHALANSLYNSADRIVSITPGIKVELLRKGLDPRRVDVFPNGFDPDLFKVEEGERKEQRRALGWDSSIVCLFTGTHTEVTAVDTLVRAAAYVPADRGIRFDFVGYGQTKPRAIALARELGLQHVYFHDPVPKGRIPGLIAAADICLMSLFESPLIHIYFENKLMDYMGSGKPIVAAMGGQQAEIIAAHQAGRVVPAFDAKGLAAAILDLAADPTVRDTMGGNGRRFVQEHLLLPDILGRYVRVIEAVARGQAYELLSWEPFA
jgi:glycosyltransferase involved in cell wall biosynthesis